MGLNSDLAEELIQKGLESPDLDYKVDFDGSTHAWMEIAKDIYGIANYGGGYIVFGVEDKTFTPIGIDLSFQKDAQEWIDRVSKWATGKINLSYIEYIKEIDGEKRKFPILYVHGSIGSFVIPKVDGKFKLRSGEEKLAFRQGILYIRRDTSTVVASGNEYWEFFWSLLRRTAERVGSVGTPLEVISALNKKAEPDIVEETLWSNLFPVTELPDLIHIGDTKFRYASDVYDHIRREMVAKGQEEYTVPPFSLEDKKIYSFSPFDEDNTLSLCVDLTSGALFDEDESPAVTSIPTQDWLNDESKQQKLVKLLNFNLKELCRRKGFYYDTRKDRYYIRYFGGHIPQITWKPYQKTSTRQLVYPRLSDITSRLLYCEHFAGKLRFAIMGNGIYLVIEPLRVLTEDGVNPLDQRRNIRISTKRNFFYHNNNYLYDMKLWLQILAGNREEIHLGYNKGRVTVDITPINAKANFGILDDQYTSEDFLDTLKSEPLEYDIEYEEVEEYNPLTETPLEE